MKGKLILGIVLLMVLFLGGSYCLREYKRAKWFAANDAMLWTGDYSEAIRNYSDLIWWNDNDPSLYYFRAEAYASLGMYYNAISDYNSALKLGIKDTLQTILRVGVAKMSKGDIESAYQEFLKLSSKSEGTADNEYWSANYHLGQIEYLKGNYRESINYYNIARGVQTTSSETYHRANAYYALGERDSAIDCYNRSIQSVKAKYILEYPNLIPAQCDTCGFPFGTQEYLLLIKRDLSKPKLADLIESVNLPD
ncbi:tetratricopeptide repeat protein [Owenweeksia hongkongensis]|uniref:Tetratricopeptide repeat protein n=1 Tax=Owenweeksia hongkongensis (strain DSM 17368 / CIP 108786 / JCM 12287 / NRRL B-23963 / UST20020801) TaxID=926562 RepID=G8R188_OWEHD|nr:tetratricopeptide repeat protein [Owenweeksia hongkongensis]AEV32803.1 tetratricopeptide repeat protein [Owenweeksia hongkongensis DSM 17368]